ncbi:MAG: DUF4238 domain-containing protein [Rhizobiaceae bacterium]
MPLDHFVPQVHLRKFYSEDGRLVGVKKANLELFFPTSKSVCARKDGSTNLYFKEPRIIEEFLKTIEPAYDDAVNKIRLKNIDAESIYTISGFIAYVMTCSPTGIRMLTNPIKASVESAAKLIDDQGLIPEPLTSLGDASLRKLLENGTVQISVDEMYPHSIGIANILKYIDILGNAYWDVMIADDYKSGFMTSDFPVAFGPSYNHRVVSKTIPLAPDIAIRIHPQLGRKNRKTDFSFSELRMKYERYSKNQIVDVNRQIVRAAESIVFCTRNEEWLVPFISKNRNYRSDTVVEKFPISGHGDLIVARQAIVPI